MKNYTFIRMKNRETGALGWKARWMINADPALPVQATHDILEHAVDTECWATGELQAFGATLFGRGQGGWFRRGLGLYNDPGLHLANELAWMLPRILAGRETLQDPGHTRRVPDTEVEAHIAFTIEEGFAIYQNDVATPDTPLVPGGIARDILRQRIAGWIRRGYRAAVQLYAKQYRLSSSAVAELFVRLQAVLEKYTHVPEGTELTIHLDLRFASLFYAVSPAPA